MISTVLTIFYWLSIIIAFWMSDLGYIYRMTVWPKLCHYRDVHFLSLHYALSSAAQCVVIGPVCGFVCLFVCLGGPLQRLLEITYIDLHQSGFIGKGSDRRQLIKYWPSCAPGKGVCDGRKFLVPPYYSQRAVLRFSERFFHCLLFFSLHVLVLVQWTSVCWFYLLILMSRVVT